MSSTPTDLQAFRERKLYEKKEEIVSISLNEIEAITYHGILEGLFAVALDDEMWAKLRKDILQYEKPNI